MQETFNALSNAAIIKVETLKKSKTSYFLLTLLAGIFIGFGMLLLVTIGGLLDSTGNPSMRIIQGISFGVALCMVIMAGADLFTGNHLVMTVGTLKRKTTWGDTWKIWLFSFVGNLVGSVLCAYMFFMTGLASGEIATYVEKIASAKMNASFTELLFRGILCNILVCLAVWCSFRLKSESAKIIMILSCVFPFITIGFEHSVANMTLLSLALMIPHGEFVSISGFIANIVPVSLGNIIGGSVVIGMSYWFGQVDRNK